MSRVVRGAWASPSFPESLPIHDDPETLVAGSVTLDAGGSIVFRLEYEEGGSTYVWVMTGYYHIDDDAIRATLVDDEDRTYTGPAAIKGVQLVFDFRVESAYDPTDNIQVRFER